MMEERVTKLEAATERHSAALAKLESDMNSRFNRIESELIDQNTDRRITELHADVNRRFTEMREHTDRRFNEMQEHTDRRFKEMREDSNQRFDQVDNRFNQVDNRFNQVDKRFDRMEASIDRMRDEFHSFTRWMIGSQITVVLAIAALATKTFLG